MGIESLIFAIVRSLFLKFKKLSNGM